MATTQPKVRFTAKAERDIYARKRNRVVIRHRSEDEVVAMIEVISPGNKSSRQALRSLVNKTNKLMEAGIHFLILDLFPPSKRHPQGIHPVLWLCYDDECDFRLPPDLPLTLVAYAIGEIGEDWQAFIEPVAVGQTLPEMPLFLTPDRYVPLPLEPTYQTAFDGVPRCCAMSSKYHLPPRDLDRVPDLLYSIIQEHEDCVPSGVAIDLTSSTPQQTSNDVPI